MYYKVKNPIIPILFTRKGADIWIISLALKKLIKKPLL